ncbi:PadR family transcriptional regulator [Nocardioides allogilvus]|uniref:PadR family transcriptional regulator n=1 Tax=Nocardioides allogilvus TaxID=2072017 RepID=UPI000D300B7F|nr:PadR family transcriptional regulator [Nocardioides allogilvus]
MNDDEPRWPAAWVRASLELGVLGALAQGSLHGYAIAQELAGRGFGLLKGGSLYPLLNRLEETGDLRAAWVEGQSGPGRREYTITEAGRARWRRDLLAWQQLGEELAALGQHDREGAQHG